MAELKKCPFCGGEAEVVKVHSGVAMFPYTVVCKSNECSASVGVFKETREKAIEAWNNRPTEAEIRASVIDEFAEKLIAHFTDWAYQEAPANDDETDRTRHIICDTIHEAMAGVDEIAEQLKGGMRNGKSSFSIGYAGKLF